MRPASARKKPPMDLAALTASPANGTIALVLKPPVADAAPEGAEADAAAVPAFEGVPLPVG